MRKKTKESQKGAISVFVMFVMMFFLVTIMGIYMIASKKAQTQTESIGLTQDLYYISNEEAEIYNEKLAPNTEIIPVYTKEQLWAIGSNQAIEIEGKVYQFGEEAKYALKNDIVLNMGTEFSFLNYDFVFGENKKIIQGTEYKILGYYDNTDNKLNDGTYYFPTNYNTNAIYPGKPNLAISGEKFSTITPYYGTESFTGNYYLFATTQSTTQPTDIRFEINGGSYAKPTDGFAKIETKVMVQQEEGEDNFLQYAWSTSKTEEPADWTNFTNESVIEKTDCDKASYYLWIRTQNQEGVQTGQLVSNAFVVEDGVIEFAIADQDTWTNTDKKVTITYSSNLTTNQKAGFGITMETAKNAMSAETATVVTATTNGYVYAEATDLAGNKVYANIQVSKISKVLPTVTLSKNGGNFVLPTTGEVTLETTITANKDADGSDLTVLQYAWSTNNIEEPTAWENFLSGEVVSQNVGEEGTWYLWVNVQDATGNKAESESGTKKWVSKPFIIGAETITFTIENEDSWTNTDKKVTITYSENLTEHQKAGFGTTLELAQEAVSEATATVVSATENGYVYAEATDKSGNIVYASIQVSKIDKIVPTATLDRNGGIYAKPTEGNASIQATITVNDESGSQLKAIQYAWSSSNTEEPSNWTTFQNGDKIIKENCEAGRYYLWLNVLDNAGNKAESEVGTKKWVSEAFVVGAGSINLNIENPGVWSNTNKNVAITYSENLTENRKAGFGLTLEAAQAAASTTTANSISVTENGYVYATAMDQAGNIVYASIQVNKIDKNAPVVTVDKNGGSYVQPTSGKATIETTVTASDTGGSELETLQYAWSDSNTQEPDSWSDFENGTVVQKTGCETGTYYLWLNVLDHAGNKAESTTGTRKWVSHVFSVGAGSITLNIENAGVWTNTDKKVTITYSSNLTKNRKAGFGTTLAAAQTAASSTTAITVMATANGFVYASATDNAGNTVYASTQVSKIDKLVPTVSIGTNGGTYVKPTGGNAKIETTITANDTGGSNLQMLQYAWARNNTTEPTTWLTFTNGTTISKTDCTTGNYYLWVNVLDGAGNKAESDSGTRKWVSNAFTVGTGQITLTIQNGGIWTNTDKKVSITYSSNLTNNRKVGFGTTLAAAQSAANLSTESSINVAENGFVYVSATDKAGNTVYASTEVSKIDKALPTVTIGTNGGTYVKPTSGNATIKTTITASDTGRKWIKHFAICLE